VLAILRRCRGPHHRGTPAGRSRWWARSRDDRPPRDRQRAHLVSRKVEVRTPREEILTATGLARHREAYLHAIRAYNAAGKPARTWPIQFLIRRTAHHVMDHTWELEDRDPG
jgi:hypothetical protein